MYRVYFLGVSTHSREDVYASSYFEAEAMIASKYGLAYSITARFFLHI
jgi:hypothetical protein